MGFVRLDEKRIEDENEYKYEYDDDIIAGCVLPASNRRDERWIALLVNFRSTIQNRDPPFAIAVIQTG